MLPLPVVEAEPGAPLAEVRMAHLLPGVRCRALVVEDDAHSRELLVRLLTDVGCEVQQAEDGQAGLEACRSQAFDILFSDIRMPRMSGVDLVRALRAEPATAHVPVIAVSASSLEHERRFYVDIGFQDFVAKPYPFQDIYRVLAQHAGVRLREEPTLTPAAQAAGEDLPAALPPDAQAWPHLRALHAAAAEGEPGGVKRALAALGEQAVDRVRRRAWEEAARRYDFQSLEKAVQDFMEQAARTPA
jgi:CheY-like chemotaxis protein